MTQSVIYKYKENLVVPGTKFNKFLGTIEQSKNRVIIPSLK